MGGKLVTNLPPDDAEDSDESRPSPLCYDKTFDEYCAYYMSIGMSYDDYWDGDCCKAKYYREMDKLIKKRRNEELWLQGLYIYNILINVSPVFNPLSTRKKPYPYFDIPIPISSDESKAAEQIRNQKKLENGKEAMRAMMIALNKQFTDKSEERRQDDGD